MKTLSEKIMKREEIEENLTRYCGEIKRFVRTGDFSSAQILVSYLRKFIIDLKKESKKKKAGELNK